MKLLGFVNFISSFFSVILITGLIQDVSASDYCTYYDFYVYDRDTGESIDNADVTVTYKTINWGPNEISDWSRKTASDETNSSGCATIYCMDCGHLGLFDISSGSYFGPYAESNAVINSVKCEASGYSSITLTAGTTFPDEYQEGYVRAGSDRGNGLTFYLESERGSTDYPSINGDGIPTGEWTGTYSADGGQYSFVMDFSSGVVNSSACTYSGMIEELSSNNIGIDFPYAGYMTIEYTIQESILTAAGYVRAYSDGRIINISLSLSQ